ncbi:hypothetical protein ACF0H5_007029 [Mactra antiquata]
MTEKVTKDTQRIKSVRRQCSFQRQVKDKNDETGVTRSNTGSLAHRQTNKQATTLPEVMKEFHAELKNSNFSVKKKQPGIKRCDSERRWINGNEMGAFYKTWQTSDDHVTDQTVRSRIIRRGMSVPVDFRFSEYKVVDEPKNKQSSDFGIVRECCCHPRMRIPTFYHPS